MSGSEEMDDNRLKLPFVRPGDKISRRELFKRFWPHSLPPEITTGHKPFGKVKLNSLPCVGCGLCALDCPTHALTTSSSEENNSYQLLFRHDLCVACDKCIRICPEKCLELEHLPEPDKMASPPVVLFNGEIARCRKCGSIIGSRAMIDALKAKIMVKNEPVAAQLDLCPDCKIGSSLIGDRDNEPA